MTYLLDNESIISFPLHIHIFMSYYKKLDILNMPHPSDTIY